MRKNVLIFGHDYSTQFIDITNQYTKLFDQNKYDVIAVYLTGEANEAIRQKHLASQVIFLNSPKKSVRNLKLHAIKKMLELTREKQFEIVICHRFKPTYVMLWVAKFFKIPALFSVMHELGTLSPFSRKFSLALLAQDNLIVAGVSDAVRDDLRRAIWRIPKERVMTLHNMIDVEFTETHLLERNAARKKLNLAADDFVFGNIGRLAKNKDQKTLIEAFAKIKPDCANAKLIIIGDGILEQELKSHVNSLGLTNEIIFTGFLPNAFSLMKAFDVFTLSSIQEAFGRVLLEAMIAKIPIIATRVNGIPEVVGDAGTLIESANVSDLAITMLKAYEASHQERHAQAEQAYLRATQQFSLQRFNEIFWQLPIIQQRVSV